MAFEKIEKHIFMIGLCFGLIASLGFIALIFYVQIPSETGVLFGLSPVRLLAGIFFLGMVFLSGGIAILSMLGSPRLKNWVNRKLVPYFSVQRRLFSILTWNYLFSLFLIFLILMGFSPLSDQMPFLEILVSRFGAIIVWMFIVSIMLTMLLVFIFSEGLLRTQRPLSENIGLSLLVSLIFFVPWGWFYWYTAKLPFLHSFETSVLGMGLFFLAWGWLNKIMVFHEGKKVFTQALLITVVFMTPFWIYHLLADWAGWFHASPGKSYWDLLSFQFLQGKLYLIDPPTTHDLTLYNGYWYVPSPPLPALVMLPLALFSRSGKINTIIFSIFFSAINCVLVFLILDNMRQRGWIKLKTGGILLLTVLFGFGTNHLWVGLNGRMWFVSQILTVTFTGLAVLFALKSWSPWFVGVSAGAAILARPNILLIWPMLFFIFIEIMKEKNIKIFPRSLIKWILQSALPIIAAIFGLLVYNYIRFDNYLDFGYVTINGAETIVQNVQNYGMFNMHFLPHNLWIMFINLPSLRLGSGWPISPDPEGMSMFFATPALIYIFRKYQKHWWIVGAWITIGISILALAMYHNTGANQFGYRYILDFIYPLWMVLAVALDKKIPKLFIGLVIASILINIYGAIWFLQN